MPVFFGLIALALGTVTIPAHQATAEKTSGQGKLRFRVAYTSTHLPAQSVDRYRRRLRRRNRC